MDATVTPSNETSTTHADRTPPDRGRRNLKDTSRIQGWGADRNPADRPGYPMERTPPRLDNVHWEEPAPQHSHVKVFHSTERPGITPVYGTSAPPRGLSGLIRSLGYRYSENDLRRWFILMAADRVDVGEGLLEDLAHGHLPNLWKETGGPAEWRHNREGLVRKAAIATVVVTVMLYLARRKR